MGGMAWVSGLALQIHRQLIRHSLWSSEESHLRIATWCRRGTILNATGSARYWGRHCMTSRLHLATPKKSWPDDVNFQIEKPGTHENLVHDRTVAIDVVYLKIATGKIATGQCRAVSAMQTHPKIDESKKDSLKNWNSTKPNLLNLNNF